MTLVKQPNGDPFAAPPPDTLSREQLPHLVRQAGLSLAAASRRIGRNHAYLQQYVRRGSPRYLSERDRHLLARILSLPARESIAMAPEPARMTLAERPLAEPPALIRIACPWTAASPLAEPGFLLDAGVARALAGQRTDSLAAMLADSDAMAPTIHAGDQLLLDTSQRTAERDGLYALPGESAPLIRRVCLDPLTRRLNVLADNPAYPSQHQCERRSLTIVGRVIWIGRCV